VTCIVTKGAFSTGWGSNLALKVWGKLFGIFTKREEKIDVNSIFREKCNFILKNFFFLEAALKCPLL
jgi:hypothetical protein